MKGKDIQNIIRGLIANGDLWKAIELGIKHFPKNDIVIHLAWRYKDLERQNNKGIIYWERYQAERNKISLALLSLLTGIKPDRLYPKNRSWRVRVLWVVIIAPILDYSKLYGLLTTTIFIILTYVATFAQILKYPDPPPDQTGILVSFSHLNFGQGEKIPASRPPSAPEQGITEVLPGPKEMKPKPVQNSEPEKTKRSISTKENIVKDEQSQVPELNKEQEKKREEQLEAKHKADIERKKRKEAERKRKEAAAKKAAAEAAKKAEAERLKGEIGGLFGQTVDGKGSTRNQDDPNGDPNASNLEGTTSGSGMVGGGLGNRGGKSPNIYIRSQAIGRVVVKVCVDFNGKVISAKYTQAGSTTSNSQLRRLAEANAMKWTFKQGELDKQCGTITYDFKVK